MIIDNDFDKSCEIFRMKCQSDEMFTHRMKRNNGVASGTFSNCVPTIFGASLFVRDYNVPTLNNCNRALKAFISQMKNFCCCCCSLSKEFASAQPEPYTELRHQAVCLNVLLHSVLARWLGPVQSDCLGPYTKT